MINRRRVIVGGIGLVGMGGLAAWGVGRIGLKAEIVALLKRRLDYLKLDEQGVQTFATDRVDAMFNKKIPTWNRLRYHFGAGIPSAPRFQRTTDARSQVVRFEDAVVQLFLLSSNFFVDGADESRVVRYVGYFDPTHPCQNPFARQVIADS
jgi:hypothetical protein